MTWLWVALGAAVGAPLRYALGQWLDGRFHRGTLVANTLGSLLLGMTVGWSLDGAAVALVAVGFCGGLTTYSSFAVQVRDLPLRTAVAYAATTVALGLLACTGGFLLAR
ncbi:CrcB family protein [Nocardioides panacisoli]|uniref:fluoride efflux transporter FluC n=1 Tax=Nocardioides panacisoli TaxID=627624 RepID=UPI001C6340B1|nr:CrcB family protein [Nocardioides panacisoli]QYJ02834.1 CrcB family protein [Nocardioides panacisoli]